MGEPIRVIQCGLGPTGAGVCRTVLERPGLTVVAAVDPDPVKCGRDLADAVGWPEPLRIEVVPTLNRSVDADVAVLTTHSRLETVEAQLAPLLDSGMNVVSTCEELTYPWASNAEAALRIDRAAKAAGVSVLAAGVNPGFVMDFLPSAATAVCNRVVGVSVERVQDAAPRRIQFQRKIGVGLANDEFRRRVADGRLGHVGLQESVYMIAAALGWGLDRVDEVIEPVTDEQMRSTDAGAIEPGTALGIDQTATGHVDDREAIKLVFRASVGELDPRDRIVIEGTPGLEICIAGGVHGDVATWSIAANAVPVVVRSRPGLLTMLDVNVLSCNR